MEDLIRCTKYGFLIGAFGGAVYGILMPIASKQIILEKEGWYIIE